MGAAFAISHAVITISNRTKNDTYVAVVVAVTLAVDVYVSFSCYVNIYVDVDATLPGNTFYYGCFSI